MMIYVHYAESRSILLTIVIGGQREIDGQHTQYKTTLYLWWPVQFHDSPNSRAAGVWTLLLTPSYLPRMNRNGTCHNIRDALSCLHNLEDDSEEIPSDSEGMYLKSPSKLAGNRIRRLAYL
ncbi:hypothetical protein BDFG_02948 [Blastomyces dermatitidis ATCC 26199]|nr:hypothetical protein BDFG_02948 [Blastomyces dermatitidis ATCC 26199]